MHILFKIGWVLIILEILYACYWTGTMFYVVSPGTSTDTQRSFHAFLLVHTIVIPLTIYLIIRHRFKKPELFLLFPFTLEVFYDLYGLLTVIRYLDQSKITTYNIELAGMIWAFSVSVLVWVWYVLVLLTNTRDYKLKR
jgi:hypothetical protein